MSGGGSAWGLADRRQQSEERGAREAPRHQARLDLQLGLSSSFVSAAAPGRWAFSSWYTWVGAASL